MDLTDTQAALIRLWAHTDWHHLARQIDRRALRHTPTPVAAAVSDDDPARLVLGTDCWHADHQGIWAGGPTATASTHLLPWRLVWHWLNTWSTADRDAALDALDAFDAAVATRIDEQPRPWQSTSEKLAARDRREVRLEHGGYRTITSSRLTVQALIDANLDSHAALNGPANRTLQFDDTSEVRGLA